MRTIPRRTSAARKNRLSMQSDGERQKSEWHAPAKSDYDAPQHPQCAQQLTAPCAAKFARFRDAPPPRAKFLLATTAKEKVKCGFVFCVGAKASEKRFFSLAMGGKKEKCVFFSNNGREKGKMRC
jgi:hypothetical protein